MGTGEAAHPTGAGPFRVNGRPSGSVRRIPGS